MNQHTRGVLFIHTAPRVFCPHIEWATGAVLNQEVKLDWTAQDVEPRPLRTEYSQVGPVGTGVKLVSGLCDRENLRYEVIEEAAPGSDRGRQMHGSELGTFYVQTDSVGDVVVLEGCILAALGHAENPVQLRRDLDLAPGRVWGGELGPYHWTGVGAPVRCLHKMGQTRSFIFWRGIGAKTLLKLVTFICPGIMTTNDFAAKVQFRHKDLSSDLGFQPDEIVQEFYYDDDVGETLCDSIEALLGTQLVDEDYRNISDGAIVWWCAEDGEVDDLADLLVDAAGNLDNGGLIWVLVPRAGARNTMTIQFVEEAAKTAGLRVLSSSHVSAQ